MVIRGVVSIIHFAFCLLRPTDLIHGLNGSLDDFLHQVPISFDGRCHLCTIPDNVTSSATAAMLQRLRLPLS